MKEFLKKYSYDSMKLLVDQIALALFGVAMAFATALAEKQNPSLSWLKWSSAAGCVIFYLMIVYIAVWPIGSKDRMSADYNRIPCRPWLGACIGAVSSIPNLVLFLFVVLGEFIPALSGFKLASMLVNGMYMGVLSASVGGVTLNAAWWAYGVIIIILILTTFLAYLAGFYNFRIIPYNYKAEKK